MALNKINKWPDTQNDGSGTKMKQTAELLFTASEKLL
jgi:hypothetical protein